jgi:anti-anti-sigma regulatory factor
MNRDLGQRDTQIALCAMNQAVETLFEMVKLPQIIPCFSTVDEGLSFFNKGL